MKVKLIVGFRRDQEYSIDIEEAHKAYFLFHNPDARAVFSNGLAIVGSQIQEIKPDWIGTMGWNETHNLNGDDWNEIHRSPEFPKMERALQTAQNIAKTCTIADLQVPLRQLAKEKYAHLVPAKSALLREGRPTSIKELLQKN